MVSAAHNLSSVLYGPGEVGLEERPVPHPGPGQVLVEVAAVGVCGSDVHYYRHGRIGSFVVDSPLVLGHEASGRVLEVGPGADNALIGCRVAIEPGVPCRRCRACRTGHYNLCPHVRFLATPPVDGAFCNYLVHDADFVHPIPDSVSDDAGALMEPLSVGVWACWKAAVRSGDRVLVTGAGPIGLLAAVSAWVSGAEVSVSDPDATRREVAVEWGIGTAIDPSEVADAAGEGFDVLLECSGAPEAVSGAVEAVGPAGRAVLVGMGPSATTELPTQVLQNREISLTGTFRYAGTYPTAISLVASGRVDLDRLVTGHFGLADVKIALEAGRGDPGSIKPIVTPAHDSVSAPS